MQVIDISERHNLLTLLTFLLPVLALSFQVSCSELSDTQTQRVREALSDTLLSSTESWDVDMELIEEGVKKVRIRGSYAATYSLKELNETRIDGPVFIQVFDSTGAVTTRVRSDWAKYRAQDTEFELFGNVRVGSDEGRRLESEYLMWDQAVNRISSPRFVIITTPTDSIAGNGFEGSTDLSEYTIREVSGQFLID